MIVLYTVLTEKSGMGNFIRCKQLHDLLSKYNKAYLYVQVDKNSERFNLENVIFATKDNIRNELKTLMDNREEIFFISDFPYLDLEDVLLHRHQSIKRLFSLNDATVNIVKPDVYFNTDNLVNITAKCKSYIGFEYQIISDRIINIPKRNKNNSVKTIGIMFGGTDPGYLTEQFVADLANYSISKEYQFLVLIGNKFDRKRKDKLLKYENELISFLGDEHLVDFYNKINLIVNMGGMSTYEALFLNIPVCSVKWSHMAKYVENQVDLLHTSSLGFINESLANLENFLLHFNSELCLNNNKIDGLGAQRIVDIILEECDLIG